MLLGLFLCLSYRCPARLFLVYLHSCVNIFVKFLIHPLIYFSDDFRRGKLCLGLSDLRTDFIDKVHYFADGIVCKLHGIYQKLFRYFPGSGFHHRHSASVPGDNKIHRAVRHICFIRIYD